MDRKHVVAIAIGTALLVVLWLFVAPLLLDLADSNGEAAALGWLVLAGATIVVGWVMFRPPGGRPGDAPDGPNRRGLRRAPRRRRGRHGRDR